LCWSSRGGEGEAEWGVAAAAEPEGGGADAGHEAPNAAVTSAMGDAPPDSGIDDATGSVDS
jgi:hypothetical protein